MKNMSIKKQQGSMLLEALIGILIFSMGILAIVGLQSSAIRATTDAKYRVDASFLANQIIGQIWVDPGYVVSSTNEAAWLARIAAALPNGDGDISVSGDTVTVTITWQPPSASATSQFVTIATISGS